MPEDLATQLPILKEILAAMNIPMFTLSGWEADDILGTAGRICGEAGWDCVIVTGDRDSLQLVDEHVTVKLVTTKGGRTQSVNYTPDVFRAEYGFPPPGLIDLKALMGDSSDNYPGVPGVGEKTARELMGKYGSLEKVYENAESPDLKPAVRRKLAEGRESAYQSYDLATIRKNAPISFVPEDNLLRDWDRPKVLALFRSLEFGRLIEKYHLLESGPVRQEAKEEALTVISVTGENLPELKNALSWVRPVAVAVSEDLDALAVAVGETVYETSEQALGLMEYPEVLRAVWETPGELICHDSRALGSALGRRDIHPRGTVYDTALAAYLLEPARSKYPPLDLALQYCGRTLPQDLAGTAGAVWLLGTRLPGLVAEAGMDRVYREIDLPLCPVLSEMELTGIAVDREALAAFGTMLSARIADCEALIYEYAGGEFNINSTKQLGTLLFETLGLPHGKKTKSGWSTNVDVLESLRDKHPIVPAIMDYRMLTKLHSTYAEGLLKVIGPDGRIHTTFQNTVTATGRLSSTDPNLQNIPVRTELGGEIRKMFVPRPGWVLVDADYSQIELRVLAHIAGDPVMQEAFRSGADFHTLTAARVFGVDPDQVTPRMRRSAKAVNFGIVYGISDFSLAGDLGVSRKEAREYIDGYLRHYRGVKEYMERVVSEARETGYVESLYGRRRALPELRSSNFNVRSGAERIALNTPIQGTAADIIKLAMIRVRDAMAREQLEARLVLQVHDELIVECPEKEAEQVTALVTREMEHAAELQVPLVAEAHSGKSWYEAK